jgi:regulator of replication initiation timing
MNDKNDKRIVFPMILKKLKKLEAENAELKEKLKHCYEWIDDLRLEVKELKARWEELEEIEHEHRTIEGKQWISLGLLKRRMRELEKKGMK